ncbi:G-protein coupled receptor 4-like [Triplophysa dalaica]|uniref:G-protein coupled receptor 4-like n=1 Tax=Triplophysa dalaica TaxID=1582913 RepID=UPI0024DF3B02|nr:G-protein coupled receptor 4-like [Triplophysa dalaica]
MVELHMYPTVYSLFFIVGFPANCLSLYVAWILTKRGNNLAVYLICLSVGDLLYILTLPVWIVMALRHPVDDCLCSIVAAVMYNSFYVGSGFLCCISMDRYLAIVFPLHFSRVREVRTAVLVSILVWTLEIAVHLSLLAHTGTIGSFCSHRSCVAPMHMSATNGHEALIRAVLGFLIPALIMTFCFLEINRALRKSMSTLYSERRKICCLLLSLLFTYLVSFTPFQVVMFIRALQEKENGCTSQLMIDLFMVFVATTTINSVLDPIIYCLMNESAKTEMKKLYLNCEKQLSWIYSSVVKPQ